MEGVKAPPGQKYISSFIIYRTLGQPRIDIDRWRLTITGDVGSRLELRYDDLLRMPMHRMVSDFHCVTGWSIKGVVWEGVKLGYIVDLVKPSNRVRWVYVVSMDGYSTVIPYRDFTDERALLVIKMNGRPLEPEHGYPVRIFIPHLYGWKSAKWVREIFFTPSYRDGYWEALGYHERGNVYREERFKELNINRGI